jgi:hypothetical protein
MNYIAVALITLFTADFLHTVIDEVCSLLTVSPLRCSVANIIILR